MNFKEKIDNLLRVSGKKFNSIYDLELKSGVGTGTIRKAYDENREPSKRTIWKFLESLSINTEWWETGKGEIYLENPTPVPKSDDNKKNPEFRDNVYRTIVEGNTEYVLIPRTVLNEVQLISTKQLENDRRVMDKLLDQNEKLIAKVIKLEPQLPGVKEGK